MQKPKVLFVLKRRELGGGPVCNDPYIAGMSSGLTNSVNFIMYMLTEAGIECRAVEVIDNNYISREVAAYKPTHVVIEALWVVPEKFDVLLPLHPDVKWIVRLHSDIPFIANEGIAIDWIKRYVLHPNVFVAANSSYALQDVKHVLRAAYPTWSESTINLKIIYLPNSYPHRQVRETAAPRPEQKGEWIDVGCFGAVRPMKNQLAQAVALLRYAHLNGLRVRFHINGGRNEQGGDSAMKNLRALFSDGNHILVEHPWLTHAGFLKLVNQMHLVMCVSFSETFCIVAADAIASGVPTVVSDEIEWASSAAYASTTVTDSIVSAIGRVLNPFFGKLISAHSFFGLRKFCEKSKKVWVRYLEGC